MHGQGRAVSVAGSWSPSFRLDANHLAVGARAFGERGAAQDAVRDEETISNLIVDDRLILAVLGVERWEIGAFEVRGQLDVSVRFITEGLQRSP
jgi:hypothetical protein